MRKLEIAGDKFYEIWTENLTIKFRFGKIGSKGQLKLKKLDTPARVAEEVERLVAAKLKEGFVEVGATRERIEKKPSPRASAGPDRVLMTDEIAALVLPHRTSRPKAEKIDVEALGKGIAERAQTYSKENTAYFRKKENKNERTAEWLALFEGCVDKLTRKVRKLDVDEEAAHFAVSHDESELARYWVGTMGAEFALRAYIRAWRFDPWGHHLWIDKETVGRDSDGEWLALKSAMLLDDDAGWAKARRAAEAFRATGPVAMRCVLSFLMDDAEWAKEDAAAFATAFGEQGQHVLHRGPQIGACLLAVVRDREAANGIASTLKKHREAAMGKYGRGQGYLPTLLADLGPDALEPIRAFFDGGSGRETPLANVAKLITCIDGADAARALVRHLEHKQIRPLVLDYANRHPVSAAIALVEAACANGKNAESAKRALLQVLKAGDVATAVESRVGPAEKKLLASLGSTKVEEASERDLPKILLDPPWIGKRAPKPNPTVNGLKPIPFEESIEWSGNEHEKLLALGDDMPQLLRNWGNLPKSAKRRTQAIDEHVSKALVRARNGEDWFKRVHFVRYMLDEMTDKGALKAWNEFPPEAWTTDEEDLGYVIARFGYDAWRGLIAAAEKWPAKGVPALARLVSPRVALLMADAAKRLKKVAPVARKWLAKNSEPAAIALLPLAFGGKSKEREVALGALRLLDPTSARKVADRYGKEARAALDMVLAFDPLCDLPAKIPSLPSWLTVDALARPTLKKNKKALPKQSVEHVVTMMALAMPDYPGVAIIKEECNLADLAWDVFLAWNLANAPAKDDWALTSLGIFGDDECARRLAPRIREWPGEGGHARAVKGLDVLAEIGTDIALMHLDGIAQKVKFKGLQEKARAKIAEVAEARGLTGEELGDRLVPDLDLEPDGSKVLSSEGRTFTVRFDEKLVPYVVDDANKRLPDLPKSAKEAAAEWKTIKKDAKAIAQHQLMRLERAMCMRRRWDASTFRTFFVEHPLVVRAIRSLVLGVYGKKLITFRVAEDRSFSDANDAAFTLPDDASIGIVHRLEIDDKLRQAWGGIFSDYEIIPSFPQLEREVFEPMNEEKKSSSTKRFEGKKTKLGKVLGLEARGWRRGAPQDAGWIWDMVKPLGDDLEACIHLDGGILASAMSESPAEQGLGTLVLREKSSWKESKTRFGELDPVLTSELFRDLSLLD